MPFASLGLSPALAAAAAAQGFQSPTPIQAEAIPPILRGADLLGQAQTGSGKTAAFALPLLQRVQEARLPGQRSVQALVLVPTRELAAQVGGVLRDLVLAKAGTPGAAPQHAYKFDADGGFPRDFVNRRFLQALFRKKLIGDI